MASVTHVVVEGAEDVSEKSSMPGSVFKWQNMMIADEEVVVLDRCSLV